MADTRNKRIVLTGASDGLGAEAARQLVRLGHEVIIVGRSPEKTARVASELGVPYHLADYAKLADVRRLAEELLAYERIDVLANNAGGIMAERRVTEDGFEATFQVNLLAGFLLTRLLQARLEESGATVIFTSSIASNLFARGYDGTDLNSQRAYSPTAAYGQAKLENLLLARELERRWGPFGVHAVAFEPGVARTNFGSGASWAFRLLYHTPLKYLGTTPVDKGAGRLVRLALGVPGVDFEPGMAYSEENRFRVWCEDKVDFWGKELWGRCDELLSSAS